MKSFRFRLERVLSWRTTQLSFVEAKLAHLTDGLRREEDAIAEVLEGREAAQAAVGRAASVSGADLGTLEMTRVWAIREEKRRAARAAELQRAIEEQHRRVAEARREVKLVERLKERKYETWKGEADHEMDELAGESAIAQWRRLNH